MISEQRIKELIAQKLNVDILDVVPRAELLNDLGAESLAIVDLIMSIEEESDFKIEISDEEAGKIITVQDIFDLVLAEEGIS